MQLLEDNRERCQPPHPEIEVGRIAASAMRYQPARDAAPTPTVTAGPSRLQMLSIDELMTLPPAEWLIESVMECGTQVVLYGSSGAGKSFTALDWALSVAAGQKWVGRTVKNGPVIYVVAEGGRGIVKRVKAWQQKHHIESLDDAFIVLEAVQLRNHEDVDLLLSRIDSHNLRPALIVLDTFAQCFVGGEENSSKDVGEWFNAARRIQEETGATVVAVHHTGKSQKAQDIERGSGALRGSADVMILQRKKGNDITVSNTKQRDQDEFKPITLRLETVSLESGDTSCVLRHDGETTTVVPADSASVVALGPGEQEALEALAAMLGGSATSRDWRAAIAVRRAKLVSRRTFQNWLKQLKTKGHVEEDPNHSRRYQLTAACANASGTPSARHQGAKECHSATPLKGVAHGTGGGTAMASDVAGDGSAGEGVV